MMKINTCTFFLIKSMCSLSGIALKVGIIANVPKEKGQYEPFVSNMFLYVLLIHLCFTDSSVM